MAFASLHCSAECNFVMRLAILTLIPVNLPFLISFLLKLMLKNNTGKLYYITVHIMMLIVRLGDGHTSEVMNP